MAIVHVSLRLLPLLLLHATSQRLQTHKVASLMARRDDQSGSERFLPSFSLRVGTHKDVSVYVSAWNMLTYQP